jgi:serine/threonine protein phosphatase PrpC
MLATTSTYKKFIVCTVFGILLLYFGFGAGRSHPDLVLSSLPIGATTDSEISRVSTVSSFDGSRRCKELGTCKIVLPAVLTYPTTTTRSPQKPFEAMAASVGPTEDDTASSLCTLKGHKGNSPNQDRILLIETPTGFLAALFDGHGTNGQHASEAASRLLPAAILDALDNSSSFTAFVKDTFLAVDTNVMREDGGTTGFIMLQHGDNVHLAWVGDSKAFLVRWQDRSPQERTIINQNGLSYEKILEAKPHKPADPEERLRIEKHGGQVYIPTNSIESSRVVYIDEDEFGIEMQMALAMSRSLGDRAGKLKQVVSAEPSFGSFTLPPSGEYYVVLASDGVTDMISQQVLLTRIGQALFASHRHEGLAGACQGIITEAADAWGTESGGTYRDDISLLIRRIGTRKTATT